MEYWLLRAKLIIRVPGGSMDRTAKILLVEDNPDEEELALFAFKKTGIDRKNIIVVRDGQEAVDYLYAQGDFEGRDIKDAPRVVFLDLNIPKIHGLEVLKLLRNDERTATLPIVILTSSDEQSDIQEGYRAGANSYICKPFDFDKFVSNIKSMGDYWLDMNVAPNDK